MIGLDRTQAVSESGSGGCPPEVVMAGAVLVVVVGTGSGCRACMSQVWEPRFFRSFDLVSEDQAPFSN